MSSAVPDGWEVSKLEDRLYRPLAYGVLKPDAFVEDGVPMLRIQDVSISGLNKRKLHRISEKLHLEFKRTQLREGDLVISLVGTIGRVLEITKSLDGANVSRAFGVIGLKDDIDRHYIRQFLTSQKIQDWIQEQAQGNAQKVLNLGELRNLSIVHPPLPEQKKIASILTSVDEVIENTQKQIDKLQDLKKATMNELLTKGIGHTEFKDSELGRIPESWEVVNLRERFTFGGGSTPSRANTEYFCSKGKGYVWVKTTDLNDSDIFDSEENITKEGLSASSCKIHPAGTVVVAMYGGWNQIGRSGLLRNDASINQALTAILPSESIIPPFLNYWLVTMRYLWKLIAASSRKDPNITKADVEGFKIAIPSIEEQQEITKIADSISHQISMAEIKLSQTQSLKKSLMQDLLTGKVRVTVN